MPKKDEILQIVETRTKENADVELHIFSDEELNQRMLNHESDVVARKTGELYQNLENDVFTVTGVKKEQGEKAYNYLKRVLTDLQSKASASDVVELKKQLQTLEEEKAKGFPNMEKEINDIKLLAKKREEELQSQLNERDKKLREKDIEGQIALAQFGLKFRPDMPKEVITTFVKNVTSDIISRVETDDTGRMVIKGSDGKILRNPSTLDPLTIAEVLVESLTPIIEDSKKKGGGGSGTDDVAIKKDADGNRIPPSDALKSKETLSDWLRKEGIPQGSKEFTAIWGKYATNLPRTV